MGATATHAATLDAIQGGVFVNHGDGYHAVGGTTELSPGDQVMANGGGSAQIVYPDGCKIPLGAGQVIAIGAKSPCTTIETGSVSDPTSSGGIDGHTLLIGGVVVGGAVAAAVLLSDDDDDNNNGNGNGNGGGGGGGPPPASP